MTKISGIKKEAARNNFTKNQQPVGKRVSFEAADPHQTAQKQAIQNSPFIAAQRKTQTRCFGPDRLALAQKKTNKTGIPDEVKHRMEQSHNADFSDVRIHPASAKAPEVGALAYTQGSDIHFAPGQFSPESASGKHLLGHELTHVVQQREGRVTPTTEVKGMPVNDNPALEQEADDFGKKASL